MKISIQTIILIILVFTLTLSQDIQRLIDQLFNLCQVDQRQTISLYQCQPKIIKKDKQSGNFKNNHRYDVQTAYLMTKYDTNKDRRLSKQETMAMAYDIMNGEVSDFKLGQFEKQNKELFQVFDQPLKSSQKTVQEFQEML